MSAEVYLPLTAVVPEGVWPEDLAANDGASFLDRLACVVFDTRADEEGVAMFLRARVMEEARLPLPLLDGVSIVFGKGDTPETGLIDVDISLQPRDDAPPTFALRIQTTVASLSFDASLFRPVSVATVDGALQVTYLDGGVAIPLPFAILLAFDGESWSIDVELPADAIPLSLPLCEIGTTGVLVEASGISINLSGNGSRPTSAPANWRGLYLDGATLYLPKLFAGSISSTALGIGSGGLWGELDVSFALTFDEGTGAFTGDLAAELFGMKGGISRIGLAFVQSVPTRFAIEGQILLPFFDAPVTIELGLDGAGGFTASLSSPDGLVAIEKEGVLKLELDSLGFAVAADGGSVTLGGSLTPLVGGIDWPTFRVDALSIDSKGHVHLDGGWLDLPDQYCLDFHGFQLEVSQIGFGTTDDGGRWIGFSGGLRLVEGLPAAGSVEGLRVIWYTDGRPVSVTLNGVGVELAVPDVFSFRGHVAYTEPTPGNHRFDGAIRLSLEAIGMEIDGQIVIGRDDATSTTYFAIYIGVELPVGIPLWATGLGLYGFAGLFALNMEPDKAAEEPWYGVGPGEGWYKKPEIGVAELTKWRNSRGAVGLGAGVTIGTVADNGFAFAGRFLFAIVFPGPILMIEGKANLMKERGSLGEDPLLRALVVLDARAGTFTVGLDAAWQFADDGELVEISGGAEAFFSFADPGAWHLYLGMKDPRERRIRAEIFQRLFEANSYFMLDAHQLALGAWVGYDKKFKFGPVKITIEAWMEGGAVLSWKPAHFHGELWLHGALGVSVCGFGFDLGADARVTAEVFDPFSIWVELGVHVGLPWPLPDVDVDASFGWGPEKVPPKLPLALKGVSVAHAKASATWVLSREARLLRPDYYDDGFRADPAPDPTVVAAAAPPADAPVVPLDARPQLVFGQPVHDDALIGANAQPPSPTSRWIGDPSRNEGAARVRYGLRSVALQAWNSSAWSTVASRADGVADDSDPDKVLYGTWAPVPASDGGSEAGADQTRLQLWSRNPFDYTRLTSAAWGDAFLATRPMWPCVDVPRDETWCGTFDFLPIGPAGVSPIVFPEHPEVFLGWDLPTRPLVADVGTTRALCLAQADELLVRVVPDVKQIVLAILERTTRPARAEVDLLRKKQGEFPNPYTTDGFVFEVLQIRPPMSAATCHLSVVNGIIGLDLGSACIVTLPASATMVELDITCRVTGGVARGEDPSGTIVADSPIERSDAVRTVRLASAGDGSIARVELTGVTGNVWLHAVRTRTRGSGHVRVTALDRGGHELADYPIVGGQVTIPGEALRTVRVRGAGVQFCLTEVCVTTGLTDAERVRREEMATHLKQETSRWTEAGYVLAPYTNYRLKIVTTLEVSDWAYEDDTPFDDPVREQTEYAFFRTEGPPGVVALSPPTGATDPSSARTGLEDLSRYVAETIPPTVPSPTAGEGAPVILPPAVFRGYDVGVLFNEDYVDLMYRASGRDLGLYLFDDNDRPARDATGRVLALANAWGRAETSILDETDQRWVQLIGTVPCANLAVDTVLRSRTLGASGQVLAPRTRYEARLVPLLVHEDFRRFLTGTTAGGTGAVLSAPGGGWSVRDDGTNQGPSRWVVGETPATDDTSAVYWVEQRSNIWGGADDTSVSKPGTLLLRAADPALPSDHPDQPANWSDLRLQAILRAGDDDAQGLGFRVHGDDAYLFVMDRQRGFRRLIRVSGGTWTILAEDTVQYEFDRDYAITVEVVGSDLRVRVDGDDVFSVIDDVIPIGGIGLYCWGNESARFADVRVDDLRATAAVVYRFGFTTSNFVNFYHQVQSSVAPVWDGVVAEPAALADAFAAGTSAASLTAAISLAEAAAYANVATAALGNAVLLPVPLWESTLLSADGAGVALLVRTAEPIDWERASMTWSRATGEHPALRSMADEIPASGAVRITSWSASPATPTPAEEAVTILLRDAVDLSGYAIEYRTFPGEEPVQPDGTLLAEDTVQGTDTAAWTGTLLFEPPLLDSSGLSTFDEVGVLSVHGVWQVSGGIVKQTANAGAISLPPWHAPGALLFSNASFGDAAVSVTLRNDAGVGAVGLIVRHAAEDHWVRFSLSPGPTPYRRLVLRSGSTWTVLWQDATPGATGADQVLRVEVIGTRVRVMLDEALLCDVTDAGVPAVGRAGMYTARCTEAVFSGFSVRDRTGVIRSWRIEEAGVLAAPSAWVISDGALRQTADVAGGLASTVTAGSFGTFAVWEGGPFTDFRLAGWVWTELAAATPDALGVSFRRSNVEDGYALVFDARDGTARLLAVVGGVVTTLWQGVSPTFGAPRRLVVQAIGQRLACTVDGVSLFDLFDATHASGGVALYGGFAGSACFSAFSVEAAVPAWSPWYTFAEPRLLAAGRQVALYAGREEDVVVAASASEVRRFKDGMPGDGTAVRFPAGGVDLRVVDPAGEVVHAARFAPDELFVSEDVRILRTGDATAFLVYLSDNSAVGAAFLPGIWRAEWTWRRNNTALDPASLVRREWGADEPEAVRWYVRVR